MSQTNKHSCIPSCQHLDITLPFPPFHNPLATVATQTYQKQDSPF